jgi:hypothetical protein
MPEYVRGGKNAVKTGSEAAHSGRRRRVASASVMASLAFAPAPGASSDTTK